jgi:hypothetical protein
MNRMHKPNLLKTVRTGKGGKGEGGKYFKKLVNKNALKPKIGGPPGNFF